MTSTALFTAGFVALLVLLVVLGTWLRKLEERRAPPDHDVQPVTPAEAAVVNGSGAIDFKRLCLAHIQGHGAAERRRIELALLPQHDQAAEVIRLIEIAFESLAIVEKTKNAETLTSRLFIAREHINQASALAPEVFPAEHRDELVAVLDEAASGRLADIAIAKIQNLQAKADAAKSEATKNRTLSAASAYAKDAARHPNIAKADRLRIRDSVRSNRTRQGN